MAAKSFSDREKSASPASSEWPAPALQTVGVAERPFRYATLTDCFSGQVGDRLLDWFDDTAPWTLKHTDFYDQFEFSCWDDTSASATYLTSPSVIETVCSAMTAIFDRQFQPEVSVVCHKLVDGHRIGIHNDFLEGGESHRLTIQLNRGLTDGDGGMLMLFNSGDPSDLHRVLRPHHLSALAFEISPGSFHAVSQMHGGTRYTVIYSLREWS